MFSKLNFHDADSPLIENLTYFHDWIIVVIFCIVAFFLFFLSKLFFLMGFMDNWVNDRWLILLIFILAPFAFLYDHARCIHPFRIPNRAPIGDIRGFRTRQQAVWLYPRWIIDKKFNLLRPGYNNRYVFMRAAKDWCLFQQGLIDKESYWNILVHIEQNPGLYNRHISKVAMAWNLKDYTVLEFTKVMRSTRPNVNRFHIPRLK